jgi:hypothetical protein
MGNIPPEKVDKLASDVSAYWKQELGEDFVSGDGTTFVQFDAMAPALQVKRDEKSEADRIARQKSDAVDDQEAAIIQAAVNLRRTVETKWGRNSRQYKNAYKIPRYPEKKPADAGSGG